MIEDSLYLDNIEEYVQDESRIVTYKWLSRNLEVPVNVAKQMLYSYVSKCQKRSDHQISVTYLISGIADSKSHHVRLVEEKDLEDVKKQLSSLLGVHIYSVQKGQLKESSVLYTADYDVGEEHIQDYSRWSTIKCPMEAKQATSERKGEIQAAKGANPSLPKLSHKEKRDDMDSKRSVKDAMPSQAVKDPKPPKQGRVQSSSKPKLAPKGSMMAFFSTDKGDKKTVARTKKEVKPTKTGPQVDRETEIPSKSSSLEPPAKCVPHTETRNTGSDTSEPTKPSNKSKASGMFQGLHDSDIDDEDSDDEKPPAKQARKMAVKTKANGRGLKKVAKQEHVKADKQPPKRKRVRELSSDEEVSDNEFKGHAKPELKGDKDKGGKKRRKKVKKLVPKMYTNDQGEMVTERSWEMVSTDASDQEDSEPVEKRKIKVESQGAEKTERASPKKKKQITLMNFLKK